MTISYRSMIKLLRSEIIKWLDVPVVPQNQIGQPKDYPFVQYYMYEDWLPFDFNPDSPNYNVQIQMKVVSDNEEVQHELKRKLRRLFYLEEPRNTLSANGIALLNTEYLPSPPTYMENFIIFDDGWDFTFNVHAEEEDFTTGSAQMDSVTPNITKEAK